MAPFMDTLCTSVNSAAVRCGLWNNAKQPSPVLLAVALFVAVLPFDITQLIFVAVGAIFYGLVHRTKPIAFNSKEKNLKEGNYSRPMSRHSPLGNSRVPTMSPGSKHMKPVRDIGNSCPFKAGGVRREQTNHQQLREVERLEGKTFTWKPIEKPIFTASGFDAEVNELLSQILPSPESEDAVLELGRMIKMGISGAYPHAQVQSFCTGDLRRGRAFCVAVPDVDIVIHLEAGFPTQDLAKFHKATLRACTEQLVSKCGFKFRRSAFRGDEPRVTLVAPSHFGGFDHGVSLGLHINAQMPYHNAVLLSAVGGIDPRAKELILLVKRWAKDRGICHAMKGDVSPYLWGLLVIYYLQVGDPDDGAVLPPLGAFELPSHLLPANGAGSKQLSEPMWAPSGGAKGIGDLFKDFIGFYCRHFDWSGEVVSIRSGVRLPVEASSFGDSEATTVLHIEAPFGMKRDIASYMVLPKLLRLREEFARAENLCANGASLVELLELWVPAEAAAAAAGAEE